MATALSRTGQALRLLLDGQISTGMAIYDECVRGDAIADLPIGAHLLLLVRAGRDREAALLRDLTLERGGNVLVRGSSGASEPAETAREYEALFARGIGNSPMVFDYLLTMSRLGRADVVAAILAPAQLLKTVQLDAALSPQVERAILERERDVEVLEEDQSIRAMRKLEGLDRWSDPAMQSLLSALAQEVEQYRADWASSKHPLAALIPDELRLKFWALISRGQGYNVQHIHSRGWVTGVYYPNRITGADGGGNLRIGPPSSIASNGGGWPDLTITPQPGLLVIMPSFYNHWTVPLGRPGLRTSIAFDYRPHAVDVLGKG